MLWSIPTTIANVEATHKTDRLVDYAQLLVVAPDYWHRDVWMAHYFYVLVQGL
jgi:hypothetical protein